MSMESSQGKAPSMVERFGEIYLAYIYLCGMKQATGQQGNNAMSRTRCLLMFIGVWRKVRTKRGGEADV